MIYCTRTMWKTAIRCSASIILYLSSSELCRMHVTCCDHLHGLIE